MSKRTLLVSNDFPPKIGGIQNYLWELWRRLDPQNTIVYTTPQPGSESFDAKQPFQIERCPEPVLLPYPWLVKRIETMAARLDCELVLLDPALPLGLIGPRLGLPYGLILHGAETAIPARLPGLKQVLSSVLRGASVVISAGQYPLREAERCAGVSLPSFVIPPGVDHERFYPPSTDQRLAARRKFGIGKDELLLVSVSRLVPRKGMCALISALSGPGVSPDAKLRIIIAGDGRQRKALERLVHKRNAPAQLLGRVSDSEILELYHAADLMAMLCNERWMGLEQEGFGIVFLEAAACAVPQIAGRSGGAHEAVEDGVTGLIVNHPRDENEIIKAFNTLAKDTDLRYKMGQASQARVLDRFNYDHLAGALARSLGMLPDPNCP